uniref:FER tyrosine kinase n=1 Tax=Cyprinus carpio carpio TaxID=630221 RepID=A0A8C1D6J9_CYPCA
MGFGRDLRNSHEGLMKLQDWELKLLETVKRFMTLRVKSDKEYASLLLNISQQVDKHDSSSQIQYVSTVSKSWTHMVQQTEQLSKIMKCHAEELNSGPLHRLTMMIKDKQQVKKSYQSLHLQIESEMHKVTKCDLEKLKCTYRQLTKDAVLARDKYKEAVVKGKETEKARERYDKATMKLHNLHNQYVLAVKSAQLHQEHYHETALPLLLDSLQKMQEEMINALAHATCRLPKIIYSACPSKTKESEVPEEFLKCKNELFNIDMRFLLNCGGQCSPRIVLCLGVVNCLECHVYLNLFL